MRTYAFRKMTQADFRDRVRRIDASSSRKGQSERPEKGSRRPFLNMLTGFGGAYIVMTVARNREAIEINLAGSSLSASQQHVVLLALAVFLAVAAVALGINIFRWTMSRPKTIKRSNSSGVILGTFLAAALIYTPASVVEAGMGLLDDNSRSLLMAASEGVKSAVPVSAASIAFVSSRSGF